MKVNTVGGGKGYTLTSTLMIHPHVHNVDYGKEYTLTFTTCWWLKRIHPAMD
jgi:hypothetical protein